MIRCIRLWTGDDDNSHFEEGTIDLYKAQRGDALSEVVSGAALSFQETGFGAPRSVPCWRRSSSRRSRSPCSRRSRTAPRKAAAETRAETAAILKLENI